MASIPGIPGSLGLPAGTPQGLDATNPDSTGGNQGGTAIPAAAPTIIHFSTLTDSGSIPPTTEGNTLVVLVNNVNWWPYVNSTETEIGIKWDTLVHFYDGIPMLNAINGPRNPVDAATYVGPFEIQGWVFPVSMYYLEMVPGGITSIQLNLAYGSEPQTAAFAFVYEITPAVLDISSENLTQHDTSPDTYVGDLAPTLGPLSLGDIGFLFTGIDNLHNSTPGTLVSIPGSSDASESYTFGNRDITIVPCHLDNLTGTTTVSVVYSGDFNVWGGALAAFKGIAFSSGDGT